MTRARTQLTLDFPATELEPAEVSLVVCGALGATASKALQPTGNSGAVLYVYEFEEDVASLDPDFGALLAARVFMCGSAVTFMQGLVEDIGWGPFARIRPVANVLSP